MAKKMELRVQRSFSEALRKDIVNQIELGKLTISQARREYGIHSLQSIYNWIYRYSRTLKKGTRIVMEKNSHDKTTDELKKHIKELEAALGRKALEADLYRVIVEQASKEYQVDLKKSFGGEASGKSEK